MAGVLAQDIERVSGVKPEVATKKGKGQNVILGTAKNTSRHKELRGKWEQFAIDTEGDNIYVTGSDARGLAYGVFHISEVIGVSPWYRFADVPVDKDNSNVRDFSSFTYDNVNKWQAGWLTGIFGVKGDDLEPVFQNILDHYYRLAWDRKPEFMGYEMEWDSREYSRLYDTDFSFETGSAQKRLLDYQDICFDYDVIEGSVDPEMVPALFQMLGYSLHSAYQMNRSSLLLCVPLFRMAVKTEIGSRRKRQHTGNHLLRSRGCEFQHRVFNIHLPRNDVFPE